MTLTCPRCYRIISVHVTGPRYEVRTTCPYCGHKIVVEAGLPVGVEPIVKAPKDK